MHLHDGYIVTARHAVERDHGSEKVLPTDIFVLTDSLAELPAHLVGGSAYLDIVLYRVHESHRQQLKSPAPFSEKTSFAAGSLSLRLATRLDGDRRSPTVGSVSQCLSSRSVTPWDVPTDLSACSGNSGGGLFNEGGELVGVLHAIIQTEQTQADQRCSRLAFAVPGTLVKRIVTALMEGTQPNFSRLGIRMTATKVGIQWRVTAADVSGPAKGGGVQKGDILVAIDETDITDGAQLKNYLLEQTKPGQNITLRVRRGTKELPLSITLGASDK